MSFAYLTTRAIGSRLPMALDISEKTCSLRNLASERKVVGGVSSSGIVKGVVRQWCLLWCCLLWSHSCSRLEWSLTERYARGCGHLHRPHVECADAVEPSAIVFTSVDVKRDVDILPHLDVESLKLILSKDGEDHFTCELSVECLQDKLLHFPFPPARHTSFWFERKDDFTL